MSSNIGRSLGRQANIFINYRREDTAGHAGRLFDRLSGRFPGRVFMDIDTIEPGIDFVEIIEEAVGCCEVLIVMIGRDWLTLADATGRRRLDNPSDFVRLEIGTALARDIRIIPVLVEGAIMPRPEDLPPELALLTRRNAIELSDARWAFDVDRLIQTIEGVLQDKAPSALMQVAQPVEVPAAVLERPAPPAPAKAMSRAWLAALLVVLALAAWIGWRLERPATAPQQVREETPVVDTTPEPTPVSTVDTPVPAVIPIEPNRKPDGPLPTTAKPPKPEKKSLWQRTKERTKETTGRLKDRVRGRNK